MAAFVIDLSVVIFAHSLLAYFIKAKQNQAYIEGFHYSFAFWFFLNILFFFFLYFVYNYWSLVYKGKTLGKAYFHIRLRDIWSNKRLSHGQAYRYAFWKSFSLLLLGIPFLAILYDDKRRCLHEKLSDSVNLTIKNRYHLPPNESEKQFIQGMLASFRIAFVFLLMFAIYHTADVVEKEENLAVLEMPLMPACEQIDEYHASSNGKSRLEVALSMFVLNQIDSECLEVEAQAAFDNQEELALANFSYSLLYPEKRSEFLHLACQQEDLSDYCQQKNQEDSNEMNLLLSMFSSYESGNYQAVHKGLKQLNDTYLRPHLDFFRLKSLYNSTERDKVLFGLNAFKSSFDSRMYQNAIAWICKQNMGNNCDTQSMACQELGDMQNFVGAAKQVQISYVDLRVCKGIKSALPISFDDSVRDYYYAKWVQAERGNNEELKELVLSRLSPIEVRQAAYHALNPNQDLEIYYTHLEEGEDKRQPASEEP
tara:strand:- start:4808 stop:6250 length:1443 start_codon:yes stop_codon:yes gene_type:complete